jgi:hypothetical protein
MEYLMSAEKLLKDRRSALVMARQQVDTLEREIEKLTRRVQSEKIEEKIAELAVFMYGLNEELIRDALVGGNTAADIGKNLGDVLYVLGRGPWELEEFGQFLESRDFILTDEDHAFQILVLGRSISENEVISVRSVLDYHIDSKEPLVILSQELLVLALVLRENPLEVFSEDELHELARGHGGLTTVVEYEGFSWPSHDHDENSSDLESIYEFDSSALNAESPLHRLGYSVAEGRLSLAERRRYLTKMFETQGDQVFVEDAEYRIWGNARTQQRLYAIARHISWLIGFRGETAPNAAERWRSDLSWLKDSYYRSGMKFSWPKIGGSKSRSLVKSVAPTALSASWPFPDRR